MMKKKSMSGVRSGFCGVLAVLMFFALAVRVESVELVVHAGGSARDDVPVSWDLGDRYADSKSFSLW